MTDLKKGPVLVPVDFSRHSEAALVWAAHYSRSLGIPLMLLHVVHDPAETPGYYLKFLSGGESDECLELRPIKDAAEEAMEAFLLQVSGRHPDIGDCTQLDTKLVVGVPASRIVEMAESIGAQLIVMGSQGLTGLNHLMMGSKAEQVARLSPVPVTIVKMKPTEEDTAQDA